MNKDRNTARFAGVLYLLSSAAAGIPLLYLPGHFVVDGDAAATAHRILGSEAVFLACIASELLGAIVFLLMVRALYRLLHGVDERRASLMVAFVLISLPITFLNVLNEIAALTLLHAPEYLFVFSPAQRDALALFLMGLHAKGAQLDNIFWGLWLLPFGALVIRSGFIPKVLGIWIIADGVALVAVSVTGLFLPAYLDLVSRVAIAPELGELWMMAWLVLWGVRPAAVQPKKA